MSKLKIYDVKWTSTTAGPSPDDNRRTEIFLWGCNSAAEGFACEGCFNPKLWVPSPDVIKFDPEGVANNIAKHAPNKYVTIVGGEPLDQIEALSELCQTLKSHGFHIILFTHWTLKEIMAYDTVIHAEEARKLFHNIDILIDGRYDKKRRIYDEASEDGLHDAVGSANQIIWDFQDWNEKSKHGTVEYAIRGMEADTLAGLYVDPEGGLHYITKDDDAEYMLAQYVA